eukprot:1141969-Pelagomonas_calceolata.AAC.6
MPCCLQRGSRARLRSALGVSTATYFRQRRRGPTTMSLGNRWGKATWPGADHHGSVHTLKSMQVHILTRASLYIPIQGRAWQARKPKLKRTQEGGVDVQGNRLKRIGNDDSQECRLKSGQSIRR